jgi:3-hydroxyisobutyrate dehydrogenase-like beta-hydroxyacid dehydrogenase/alkylhydroperoxidase/carboxymuconolactone decarboxylase family protein YurZ
MTEPEVPLRAGVVGLGMIGGGVAVSLANSGRPASAVHDVRPEAAEGLDGVPAPVESPAAVAAASDVVLVAVNTAAQARDVLVGEQGLLGAAEPGTVVVLLSTVTLDAVRELSALCEERGVTLLDAGVTGGTVAARNGLVTMVGGPDDAVDRALPVLRDFSKHVVHCGPLGAGMATKLARNAITYAMWAAVREATSLAAAAGVEPGKLLEVMQTADDSVKPTLHLELQVADYRIGEEQAAWAVGLAEKDLDAAQELAAEVSVEVPITDLVRPRMRKVFAGELDEPLPEDNRARGRVMMDRTYGPGFNEFVTDEQADEVGSVGGTIDYLFPQVWGRPYLTLRDRRLLVVGVTSMLGRRDLLETQLRGAVTNGELTAAQLRELAYQLHPYAGWGNGTNLMFVTEKLVAELKEKAQG